MKRILFLLGIILNIVNASVAQKHDHIWLLGYDSNPDTTFFGGSKLDFNGNELAITYENREMNFNATNASICDSMSNLLFYTNGIYIANVEDEVMENGEGLNPDPLTSFWAPDGYRLAQGILILPDPNSSNSYYLIHEEQTAANFEGHLSLTPHIMFTKVDMTLDNGLGGVTEKNQVILTDTLDYGKITATKHANGKDWWILIPEFESNAYYRLLLTSEGIEVVGKQSEGTTVLSGVGQAVFSPDGTKYARINTVSVDEGGSLDIYDFDRCTGLLSNHTHIFYAQNFGAAGVAISPNSRFVYASKNIVILQYDLWSSNIEASEDTVAIYDGFQSPLSTRFFLAQLAPDNKIYLNSSTTVNTLHVINQPDSLGVACEVIQHGVQLPTLNKFSMPNFPNYRLGALDGACSPLSSVNIIEEIPCYGDSTGSISIEPIGGAYPYEYEWSDISLIGQELNNLSKGNYELTITDSFDSTYVVNIELTEPDSMTLALMTSPEVEDQMNGTASVMVSGGTSPYGYSWNTIPVQDSITAVGLSEGTYEVLVTDANGCVKMEAVEVEMTTNLNEIQETKVFRIYPNPINDYLNIFISEKLKNGKGQIIDLSGKVIETFDLVDGEMTYILEVSHFPVGVYFFKIQNEEGSVVTKQFVIQR